MNPPAPFSPIRAAARTLTRAVVGNGALWNLLPDALRRRPYVQVQRHAALAAAFTRKRERLFARRVVMQGPFAGLTYPGSEEFGSAYFPKLAGTYEAELHPTIQRLAARQPPLVIDIGCAGGYYIAGLGRMIPQARFVGYDLDAAALDACRALARANGIADARLDLHGAVTLESLRTLLPQRSLVICDCEGFEAELFTAESLALWGRSDVLIECHDFVRPGIAESLHRLLTRTHAVERVSTVEEKAKLPLLSGRDFAAFSDEEKLQIVSEGRPARMEWIVATAPPAG